jgi:hypothetical protein
MSPHHHHHLQQHQHHQQQQQQLQARSKVSEIIDKWNAHGLKSREHHTEDALGVMRRGPGDRSEIAVRRFAAQAARGSYPAQANHNYPGLYGGSCNDLYTRSDPYAFHYPHTNAFQRIPLICCGEQAAAVG